MTDASNSGGGEERRPRSFFSALCAMLFYGSASLVLNRVFGEVPVTEGSQPDQQEEYRRELLSYIWGISLALALSVVPFALVHWSVMSRFALFIAIGVFAFIQIVVHLRFFLHIDPPRQNVDDLRLILFSSLILLAMAGGTIWIMANLAMRMH